MVLRPSGSVERARQLLRRRGLVELRRLGRLLEARLQPLEAAIGLAVLRRRIAEVLADDVEVLAEAPEVLPELGAVRHDLLRMPLDLEPAQAEHDDREVRVERARRDREDPLAERVGVQAARLPADEFVE